MRCHAGLQFLLLEELGLIGGGEGGTEEGIIIVVHGRSRISKIQGLHGGGGGGGGGALPHQLRIE